MSSTGDVDGNTPGTQPIDLNLEGHTSYEEIGRGGFSVVYRARQLAFDRTVAIKVISGVVDERTLSRFERECRTMGSLSGHPNIVTVFGSGVLANGHPYLIMEYLERGSLGDRLMQGPLPWDEASDIAVKIGHALQAAHEAGVLHRDVKPENIFVSGYGAPKLGDFGIARLEGGPNTRSGVVTASVAHAAPEVLDGRRPDEATDVYSLGSTIFTLLAGAPAFTSPTDESIVPLLARIATQPVPDLRSRGIPPGICAVLEAAMAKDPLQRIGSAQAFADAMAAARADAMGHFGGDHPPSPAGVTNVVPGLVSGEAPAALGRVPSAPESPAAPTGPPSGPVPSPPVPTPVTTGGAYPPAAVASGPVVSGPVVSGPVVSGPVATAPPPAPRGTSTVAKVVLALGVAVVVVVLGVGGVAVVLSRSSSPAPAPPPSTPRVVDSTAAPTSTSGPPPTTSAPAAGTRSVDLEEGQCFNHPDLAAVTEGRQTEAQPVTVVPCEQPHQLEVIATKRLLGGSNAPYPGEDRAGSQADALCTYAFSSYVGSAVSGSELSAIYEYPSAEEWDQGERRVVCSAYAADGSELTGTVRDSGR